MPKKISVSLSSDGKVFVETDGYKGPSCVKAITELFDEFAEVDGFERKSDYYEEEETIESRTEVGI